MVHHMSTARPIWPIFFCARNLPDRVFINENFCENSPKKSDIWMVYYGRLGYVNSNEAV